jgi:hypothetical protein
MKELGGILRYIYLLQSSIEYYSHIKPLSSDMTVYRGIQQGGKILLPLYESLIGEVIVWPSFTNTSTNRCLMLCKDQEIRCEAEHDDSRRCLIQTLKGNIREIQ